MFHRDSRQIQEVWVRKGTCKIFAGVQKKDMTSTVRAPTDSFAIMTMLAAEIDVSLF